jgi:hypothetical protein
LPYPPKFLKSPPIGAGIPGKFDIYEVTSMGLYVIYLIFTTRSFCRHKKTGIQNFKMI